MYGPRSRAGQSPAFFRLAGRTSHWFLQTSGCVRSGCGYCRAVEAEQEGATNSYEAQQASAHSLHACRRTPRHDRRRLRGRPGPGSSGCRSQKRATRPGSASWFWRDQPGRSGRASASTTVGTIQKADHERHGRADHDVGEQGHFGIVPSSTGGGYFWVRTYAQEARGARTSEGPTCGLDPRVEVCRGRPTIGLAPQPEADRSRLAAGTGLVDHRPAGKTSTAASADDRLALVEVVARTSGAC